MIASEAMRCDGYFCRFGVERVGVIVADRSVDPSGIFVLTGGAVSDTLFTDRRSGQRL